MTDDFLSLYIEYNFSSGIGSREESDCIKEYTANLYADEYDGDIRNKYVGKVDFKVIYLSQAQAEGFDIYAMFDTYEYIFRHSQSFYDFGKRTFKKSILNEFPDLEYDYSKICIIEGIGIIQEFRGKGIGGKAFKDMVWHFGQDCQLFMLQPYPLQFAHPENISSFSSKLNLENFEKDKKKATASLTRYYQGWGFQKIRGINELLFYCPLYRNSAFDSINMDD